MRLFCLPPRPATALLAACCCLAILPALGVRGLAQAPGAPPVACDSLLLNLAQGENGYQQRDEWCEGVHAQQVNEGGSLLLVAVVKAPAEGLRSASALRISWPDLPGERIRLYARSHHPRISYTATTVRNGASGAIGWLLDRSRSENLTAADFGFLGSLVRQTATGDTVYVPLQIATADQPPAGDYHIVVVPTAPLKSLHLSVGVLGGNGLVTRWVFQDSLIGSNSPRDTPINVPLPRGQGTSLLKVSLGGVTTVDEPVSRPLVVRSPGQ